MADWQNKIMIEGWFEEPPSLSKISANIVSELQRIRPNVASKYPGHVKCLDRIIKKFSGFSSDSEFDDVEKFDDAMDTLYDFGDIQLDYNFAGKKMCWIGRK